MMNKMEFFDSELNNLSSEELILLINKAKDKLEEIKEEDDDRYEPLIEKQRRFTVFPLDYNNMDVWRMYKQQMAAFWRAEEINFSNLKNEYNKLTHDEQHFMKMVLAFFAGSDGIVNFNIATRFLQEITSMEVNIVYVFQMMMENIHGETYSLMLDSVISDPTEKNRLFNAIENFDSVSLMSNWAFKWIESSERLAYRIMAFCIIEGVFFSGAFAAIFWFKKYNSAKLEAFYKSNELIAKDEGMHVQFGIMLYHKIRNKLSQNETNEIMTDAVNIAEHFILEALPITLIGMNSDLMIQYIKYVADRLTVELGYSKIFNVQNPFTFMETIGLSIKTNFFEQRETTYQDAYIMNEGFDIIIDDDADF